MKLIKCHIENFGKLSNADYDFNAGLTGFCEDNGFGKTTLALFIKAMFYGLPSVRANAKEFNDRKHFYPFSGGKFGGNLTFELGGNIYRIERFFGKKSDTDDELTVYCNNQAFQGFGSDVGKAVFGVDKESFERTVFITSDTFDLGATDGMCAKLNCFVENSSEDMPFESVIAKLEKAGKNLKACRGSNDLISRTNQAVADLKAEIHSFEDIAKSLEESYVKKNALEQKIMQSEARLEEIKNTNQVVERWERYDGMKANAGGIESRLNELLAVYPCGLPDEGEVFALKNCARQITLLDGAKTAKAFDEEKRERLNKLDGVFKNGVPDSQALNSLQEDLDRVKSIGVKINGLAEGESGQKLSALKQKFENKIPTDEQLGGLESKIEKYRNLENRRNAQASVAAPAVPAKKNSLLFIVLLAVFAAVAAAGVALIFVNLIVGVALLAVGVVAAAVDIVLWKGKGSSHGAVVIDQTAVEIQAELQQTEGEVREALVAYGYYSRNGIVFDFEMLKNDLKEYLQYCEDLAQKQLKLKDLADEKGALIAKAQGIFAGYGVPCDDLHGAYLSLCRLIDEYKSLQSDSVKAVRGEEDTKQQLQAQYAAVKTVFDKYKIALSENISAQIEGIAEAVAETTRLDAELKRVKAEMVEYAKKFNLTDRPSSDIADTTSLAESIKEDRNALAILDGQISADEDMVEKLDDRYAELEASEEKLKDYKHRHFILSETKKMLEKADRNLKDRYIAPVKNIFLKYAGVIEEALGEKISIDSDFNLTFEHSGEIHSEKHFSSGLRSICALCMRLAFVENMYGEEKPFIVMDDPFVFLDEKHIKNTAKVIKELSKENQIIYFCCHESRSIEA